MFVPKKTEKNIQNLIKLKMAMSFVYGRKKKIDYYIILKEGL